MKKLLLAALLAGFAGAAIAQTTVTTTTISPEWKPQIKEYVTKEKRVAVPPPAGFNVTVGVPLPPAVELYAFPPAVPYAKYRYTVIGNETVLVDPADRKIIEVIR